MRHEPLHHPHAEAAVQVEQVEFVEQGSVPEPPPAWQSPAVQVEPEQQSADAVQPVPAGAQD
ncbi:MAG: hypothetical protein JNM69_23370 [Archangium sp.]|nr:hypothetical protein [Archangium sp.]